MIIIMNFGRKILSNKVVRHCFNKTLRREISTTDYCIESIRKNDYENFICTLLLKKEARATAIAVRAFNVEISRLTEQAGHAGAAALRFKFWEDALSLCFSASNSSHASVPTHPVILELHRVVQRSTFTKRYLTNLLESRRELMLKNGFSSLEEMERYGERSASSLLYLVLEGGGVRDVAADHAASHVGRALGLVTLLRSLQRGSSLVGLPQDMLAQRGVSLEQVARGRTSLPLCDVTFAVAGRASQHLDVARGLRESVPPAARPALLPAIPAQRFLQRLLKCSCDPFHPSLARPTSPLSFIPTLWFSRLTSTY